MLTLLANQQETLVATYHLTFGYLYIYDCIMVSVIDEGVLIDNEESNEIIKIAQQHYPEDKPFGYISMRHNSFSINPINYTHLHDLEQLKCFAIVSKKEIDFFNFKVEEHFMKNKLKIFFDNKSALIWVYKVLQKPMASEL